MARKKEKAKLPESSWLDTYADTITLLIDKTLKIERKNNLK